MTSMDDIKEHFGFLRNDIEKLPERFRVQAEELQRTKSRSVKHMRLPQILQGVAASSTINLGENTGITLGPRSGYAWCLRRLVVDGLTTGATPDIVNLYRTSAFQTSPPLWQFNGNNFGYTFGKGELTLHYGDTLTLFGTSIAATGTIRLSGELVEVAEERLGDFLG